MSGTKESIFLLRVFNGLRREGRKTGDPSGGNQ
jgi:hypothetical protein